MERFLYIITHLSVETYIAIFLVLIFIVGFIGSKIYSAKRVSKDDREAYSEETMRRAEEYKRSQEYQEYMSSQDEQ